jgi:PKHD-type hydroxylase
VSKRALLFDLDTAIMQLNQEAPKSASLVMLKGVCHILLRQWAEP